MTIIYSLLANRKIFSDFEKSNFLIPNDLYGQLSEQAKSLRNDVPTWGLTNSVYFHVNGGFNEMNRKWFWHDGNEIQPYNWAYSCTSSPHQPGTDLAITISDAGIFSRFHKLFCKWVQI